MGRCNKYGRIDSRLLGVKSYWLNFCIHILCHTSYMELHVLNLGPESDNGPIRIGQDVTCIYHDSEFYVTANLCDSGGGIHGRSLKTLY